MERSPTPIALLIGRGSKVGPLLERQRLSINENYEVIRVASHKRKDRDETGQKVDVPGIRLARACGIETENFNIVQMRERARRFNSYYDEASFKEKYDTKLGQYLTQPNLVSPQFVLMSGWDLVLGEKALEFFPTEDPEVFRFVNTHPALLPNEPGVKTTLLSTGEEVPVLKGEHDDVVNEAIRLKLPALGLTAHLATRKADNGGYIVKRLEIPLFSTDTLESYESRLILIEGQFLVEVAELLGRGQMRIEGTKVSIL